MDPNEIRDKFENVSRAHGSQWLPEESLLVDGDETFFRISTAQTVKRYVLGEHPPSSRLALAQRCFRGKPQLLDIVGKEGVATIFNTMMSFFFFNEKSRAPGIEMMFSFLEEIDIDPKKIWVVLNPYEEPVIPDLLSQGVEEDHVVQVPRDKLLSKFGSDGPAGRYLRLFLPHSTGLAPIADLNFIPQDDGLWTIDSSVLVDTICVITQSASHLYESRLFSNSLKVAKEQFPHISNSEQYKIVNVLRGVVAASSDGAEIDATGAGYVLRKLIRLITVEMLSDFYSIDRVQKILPAIFEDLLYLGYSYDPARKNKTTESISIEIENFARRIQKQSQWLRERLIQDPRTVSREDLFTWKDQRGIPEPISIKILKELGVQWEASAESAKAIPMYPIFDSPPRDNIHDWLYELHASR